MWVGVSLCAVCCDSLYRHTGMYMLHFYRYCVSDSLSALFTVYSTTGTADHSGGVSRNPSALLEKTSSSSSLMPSRRSLGSTGLLRAVHPTSPGPGGGGGGGGGGGSGSGSVGGSGSASGSASVSGSFRGSGGVTNALLLQVTGASSLPEISEEVRGGAMGDGG